MKALIPLLLLIAGTSLAQGPRAYFPWWESPLTRDIGLSEQQQEEIRTITRRYRHRMIDQRAALEKAEAALEDLFHEPEITPAASKAAVDGLVEARSAMTRSLTEMSIELRQVLTSEQWRQLEERRQDWRKQRFREMGPNRRSPRRPSRPRGGPSADHPEGPPAPPPPEEL